MWAGHSPILDPGGPRGLCTSGGGLSRPPDVRRTRISLRKEPLALPRRASCHWGLGGRRVPDFPSPPASRAPDYPSGLTHSRVPSALSSTHSTSTTGTGLTPGLHGTPFTDPLSTGLDWQGVVGSRDPLPCPRTPVRDKDRDSRGEVEDRVAPTEVYTPHTRGEGPSGSGRDLRLRWSVPRHTRLRRSVPPGRLRPSPAVGDPRATAAFIPVRAHDGVLRSGRERRHLTHKQTTRRDVPGSTSHTVPTPDSEVPGPRGRATGTVPGPVGWTRPSGLGLWSRD